MKKKCVLAAVWFAVAAPGHAQLVINEIMQSNVECTMDDIHEFPDSWVELYNPTDAAVNLKDYKIGTKDKEKKAWQLPDKTVEAKGHVTIYCDKEGLESNRLHTDFRLESGKGCTVYLFANKEIVDSLPYVDKKPLVKMPAPDVAFGRKTDGSDEWGYQLRPTPGKANTGEICGAKQILGAPVFSVPGKVLKAGQSVQLTVSLPEGAPEGTKIRYTTDGSEPTASSPEFSGTLMMKGNTLIRAKLFCDGFLSPRSVTQSYIFFPTNRELTLPVISIATNDKYLNDPKIGIYVEGTYQSGKKNYEFDWRRPINFEFFEGEGEKSVLNQLCETRIQGGATRSNALKSLAVYANKRFGEKRFSYEFFPDQKPGLTEFKSIVLRNSGNDFDYLYNRDAIMQRSMAENADLDWQAWRPAIVYINGVYRGMLNIRERSNEDNIYTNYDGLEDIDLFENWNELKEGTWDNLNAFKDFYAEHNHTLEEYAKWMDWAEFLNLMIMNLYFDNEDFPCNNIVMWRPRTEEGKWRWIAKDTDFGLGLYGAKASYNTIAWVNEYGYDNYHNEWANRWEGTRLFRRMMEDPDLQREFTDRCAIYTGDFLNEKGVRTIWDPMYDMIKTEYPYHRELFNKWWPNYAEELGNARNWLKQRTNYFLEYVRNYYKLDTLIPMTVNSDKESVDADIVFNGVKLTKGKFDGKYYKGRQVTLSGTPAGGQQVIGWTVVVVGSTTTTTEYSGATCTFEMPACTKVIVLAKLGAADGIDQQKLKSWTWRKAGNGLIVSNVPQGTRVALYDLQGIQLSAAEGNGSEITLPLAPQRAFVLKVGGESIKIKN